jgi:hypothetical protein
MNGDGVMYVRRGLARTSRETGGVGRYRWAEQGVPELRLRD